MTDLPPSLAENAIGFLVIATIVVGLIAFYLNRLFALEKLRRDNLRRIAQHFRGELQEDAVLYRPQVRLRLDGAPALVRYSSHGKRGWHTHFQIAWPDRALRCELVPQRAFDSLRRLLGMEDIEIGSPPFDEAFYITGNRREVRELLSADVQVAVLRLNPLGNLSEVAAKNVYVEFKGGVLTITKPLNLVSFEELEQFILLSAEVYRAAIATQAAGISFVEAEPTLPDAQDSRCQVCGEPLAGDIIYCSACKTPSHRDCWKYFGGCSTYACGGKKYVERRPRKRAS
ncbi:MAG: RING finger protein [Pirellulaceae bacterium]|nr:RING finger protein [Pirellulaceae bacterium]